MLNGAFKRCLAELDARGAMAIWKEVAPHLPQPQTEEQALIILHNARTQSRSMSLRERAYSHRWLLDHGYPSGLPDNLKPRAERIYPRIANSVGIGGLGVSSVTKPIRKHIFDSMSDAVLEAYADGHENQPDIVKGRMMEMRQKTVKQLLGVK
jgi:hypothetical protein